jgi:hypothetical protein
VSLQDDGTTSSATGLLRLLRADRWKDINKMMKRGKEDPTGLGLYRTGHGHGRSPSHILHRASVMPKASPGILTRSYQWNRKINPATHETGVGEGDIRTDRRRRLHLRMQLPFIMSLTEWVQIRTGTGRRPVPRHYEKLECRFWKTR